MTIYRTTVFYAPWGAPSRALIDRRVREKSTTVANIKSAKKRNRQNIVRRARNKIVRTRLRNAVKGLLEAVESNQVTEDTLRKAHSILAKAAAKGIIHKNTASRRSSRLARRIHQAASSA